MPSTRPDINSDDHYRVLGVDSSASEAEISKRYKQLALKHHPDKNRKNKDKAEEAFKRISTAYSVLSDSGKRGEYDSFRNGTSACNGMQHGYSSPSNSGAGTHSGSQAERGVTEEDGSNWFSGIFSANMRSKPHPNTALPAGTVVVLRNLAKAQVHNCKFGTIIRYDRKRERYDVQIDLGTKLSVKPQNLTEQYDLEVIGLQTNPELNGRPGSIVDIDDQTGRYIAFVQNHPTVVKLQPVNCLLSQGAHIVLYGLEVSAYNGQNARIVTVHREECRYTVCFQTGKEIKVKLGNVMCSELRYKSCAEVTGGPQRPLVKSLAELQTYLFMALIVPLAFFMMFMLIVIVTSESGRLEDDEVEL